MNVRSAFAGLACSLLLLCMPVSAAQFWIGSHNDRIVVYRVDDPQPWHTTDAIVPQLPLRDRRRLQQGFTVEGEAAMWRALEDYTG